MSEKTGELPRPVVDINEPAGEEPDLFEAGSSKPQKRGMAITNKVILGGVWGAAKLTKNVLSPPVRLVGRNVWGAKKGIAIAAGVLGIGAGSGAASIHPGETRDYTKDLLTTNPTTTAREAAPVVKDALLAAVDKAISETQERFSGTSETSEDVDPVIREVVSKYWPGISGDARKTVENNVFVVHQYYVGTKDQKPLLPPETYYNLQDSKKLIEDACKAADVPWLAGPVSALRVAESRGGVDGKLDNMTKAGALGDFMITEAFLREHGHEPTNKEDDPRLKLEITVPIVVDELKKRYEHFGENLGFAVMSWQRGVRATEDDILDLAARRGWPVDKPVSQVVVDNKITEFDLENDPVIGPKLKEEAQDRADQFVMRNAAGLAAAVHVENLAAKIATQEAGIGKGQ